MKNITNNAKKRITVAGCLAVCVILALLIGSRFQTEPAADGQLPSQSSQSFGVTVQTPQTETEKEVSVTPPDTSGSFGTNNGAVSSGIEQSIQKDVSKPEYTEKQLTDPKQKPNGEKVTELPKTENQTQGGGLPGFDNVPNAGPNQGEVVDGDGDIHKQVGTMD